MKHLQGSSKEGILWFRHGGKEYVPSATPPSSSRRKELFKGRLGAKQGELGGRQGALGAKQGELGAKQGSLGAEMGTLGSARARRGSSADDRDLDRREKELSARGGSRSPADEGAGPPAGARPAAGSPRAPAGGAQPQGREGGMHDLMDRAVQSGAAQEVR